jgi:hypothetical protein
VGSFWHVCTCPVGRAVVALSTPGVVGGRPECVGRRAAGVAAVAAHGMCPAAPGCAWVHLLCASLSALPALLCLSRILRVLRVRQGRGQRYAPRPTSAALVGRGQRLSDAEATENSSTAALPASLQIGVPISHPCLWRDNEPAACTRGSSARRLRAHDHAATTPCDGAPRALSGGEAVLAACVRSGQRQRQVSQIMLSC